MKLRLRGGEERRAVLTIGDDPDHIVTVRCPDAVEAARRIARAVNRDLLFDALVAALTPFRSDEMGNRLLDAMFFVDGLDPQGDPNKREAEKRMRKLIGAVDLILKAVEIKARGDG